MWDATLQSDTAVAQVPLPEEQAEAVRALKRAAADDDAPPFKVARDEPPWLRVREACDPYCPRPQPTTNGHE